MRAMDRMHHPRTAARNGFDHEIIHGFGADQGIAQTVIGNDAWYQNVQKLLSRACAVLRGSVDCIAIVRIQLLYLLIVVHVRILSHSLFDN